MLLGRGLGRWLLVDDALGEIASGFALDLFDEGFDLFEGGLAVGPTLAKERAIAGHEVFNLLFRASDEHQLPPQ
jgi:hypothetical protein